MKRLLALALLTLVGCTTIPRGDVLQFTTQSVAFIGTVEAIKAVPATKPKFVLTARSLDVLVALGTNDPVALQMVLTNLPVDQFQGPNGQIFAAEGALILNFVGHSVIQIDTRTNFNRNVQPVARGLRDGIRQALYVTP